MRIGALCLYWYDTIYENIGKVKRSRETLPCEVRVLDPMTDQVPSTTGERATRATRASTWLEMALQEGRNRQIRRMLGTLGYEVLDLVRVNIAGISLDGIEKPGSWVALTEQEMKLLRDIEQRNQ